MEGEARGLEKQGCPGAVSWWPRDLRSLPQPAEELGLGGVAAPSQLPEGWGEGR